MKVLLIEDQPEVAKQIAKVFEEDADPGGQPYEVATAGGHVEAIDRLDQERFDLVVTDMVMGPAADEGLRVLERLTQKSSVAIVLTAHPSMPNCVKAMRAGAWDYLEKEPADGSDAYENLLRSIREAYQVRRSLPDSSPPSPDAAWVHSHLEELLRQLPGEVVAVLDGQVVEHDPSYGSVLGRVRKQYPIARPILVSIPDTRVEAV